MQTIRSVAATVAGALAVSVPLSAPLHAQGFFATHVFGSNTNGNAGGGIFNTANALGAPGGSTHVHSLGVLGDLTLGFAVPITNAPGADFLVGENPFRLAGAWWDVFAEVAYVEVSSNGVDFARFPSRYFGSGTSGGFSTAPVGSYGQLAGQHPVLAGPIGIDAQDVVDAGGDAFDLADLAGDPLVVANLVDLAAITHVRLVDVQSGSSLDSTGAPIFDPTAGSADIDHVTVIHQAGAVTPGAPSVSLTILPDGTMTMRVEDPNGWQDLDPASLRAALFGVPVDVGGLLGAFQVQSADATGFTLVQPFPLPTSVLFTLSFSLKDLSGQRSGQSRTRSTS